MSRELDALVAEKVMGWQVVKAKAPAVFVEGEWSIHADHDETGVGPQSGWMCYSGMEPVYARDGCDCATRGPLLTDPEETVQLMAGTWSPEESRTYAAERSVEATADYAADMARWGHSRHCLQVVPLFSSDIAAAWQVVEKMRKRDWSLSASFCDRAVAHFVEVGDPKAATNQEVHTSIAATMPLAISIAALKALGVPILETP